MATLQLPKDFTVNGYLFSFNTCKIQLDVIHKYLSEESYWAKGITKNIVERSIHHSVCLGIYDETGAQIGFGRIVTDSATFAYLADVFIFESHRGKGLSKIMVKTFCEVADSFKVRRFMLATLDAHNLYRQFGFEAITNPERLMGRKGYTYSD